MKSTAFAVAMGTVLALSTSAHAQREDDARCASRVDKLQAQTADGVAPAKYGDTGCADVEAFLLAHGYRREQRMRAGMLAAGAGLFVGTYLLSAIPAAANSGNAENPWAPMMIPVAGPFIMAANAFSWASHDMFGALDDMVGVMLVVDGFAQLSGLALAVAGGASTKTVFVRGEQARVRVSPTVGKRSTGLSLAVAF